MKRKRTGVPKRRGAAGGTETGEKREMTKSRDAAVGAERGTAAYNEDDGIGVVGSTPRARLAYCSTGRIMRVIRRLLFGPVFRRDGDLLAMLAIGRRSIVIGAACRD